MLGLHPETPLPVCAGLVQPGDREEAEALLQSVITHWSALDPVNPRTPRLFSATPGVARAAECGWTLQVERLTLTCCSDQLPWSIGIVKLPWMQTAIYTEW